MVNVNSNHWIAIVVDCKKSTVWWVDSLRGSIQGVCKFVNWWLRRHLMHGFEWKEMAVSYQINGYSCGLLAWWALGHFFIPNKYPLFSGKHANDGRLAVLNRIIALHLQVCCTSLISFNPYTDNKLV